MSNPAQNAEKEHIAPIASELGLSPASVSAVSRLLTDGNTVPFIARYRKEATNGLDEVQIRSIKERQAYLVALDERRSTIADAIEEQGKLTEELKSRILACTTKTALEDLYLPFKKNRRTKGMKAKQRGLGPLADLILSQAAAPAPGKAAAQFVNSEQGVPSVEAALEGACHIVAEKFAEDAQLRGLVRKFYLATGFVQTTAVPDKTNKRTKFEQYYEFREPLTHIPSHRFLAALRGRREGVLRLKIFVEEEKLLKSIFYNIRIVPSSPFSSHLELAVRDAFKRLLAPSIENEVRKETKDRCDCEAVEVFADNLRNLLLSAPLGQKPVLGIDPGIRTGCKCVALEGTGRLLEHDTIYPVGSQAKVADAELRLAEMIRRHQPFAIAVGNGTGGREAESFCSKLLADAGIEGIAIVSVNESGASIYSASDIARREFPDLDLTVRGAVSIGRRLQDPLAELVKLDPKSIGVGQYQHDVNQTLLQSALDDVVESCVNHVGVELNTASASLLSYVAGIGPNLASKIVSHRDKTGAFPTRNALLKVPGLGPRTFEQAAGFLRVRRSKQPLDASAVHPERYALVEQMARDNGVSVSDLVGNEKLVGKISIKRYINEDVGEPTLRDIVGELKKPGRDPRDTFDPPKFRKDVVNVEDLETGMMLEGVVTNVTAFGAFVDIGVHQDGLIHISQLADRFVRDPHEVVQVGQKLVVRVLDVDVERRRIALSTRQGSEKNPPTPKKPQPQPQNASQKRKGGKKKFTHNPLNKLKDG